MSSRYLPHNHCPPNDLESVKQDIRRALVANTKVVRRHTPDNDSFAGGYVYVGSAGTSMLNYRLAELHLPELSQRDLIAQADAYLDGAFFLRRPALCPEDGSFLETHVGVATLVLHRQLDSSSSRDPPFAYPWKIAAKNLQDIIRLAESQQLGGAPTDYGDCEVLYGRAGLLYALLFLRASLVKYIEAPPDVASVVAGIVSESNIRCIVDAIMIRGQIGAAACRNDPSGEIPPPLMWSWHKKTYLGAAHGAAGILHILLLCPMKVIAPYIPSILSTVDWLVDLQHVNGNWPTKWNHSPRENELVHWCHGGPGILILLSTVLRRTSYFPTITLSSTLRDKINASIDRGAALVYSKGFLRKGVGLCHGVGGSVYALLAAADAQPENTDHFKRAIHLAHLAIDYVSLTDSGQMSIPDRPWSLYEGTAGMCCAWAEIIKRMERGKKDGVGCGMPAFDDILSED